MHVHKLSEVCGVQVRDVDLAHRSLQLDQELKRLFDEHGLIVFRNQTLTKQQLVDAGAPFGGTMAEIPAASNVPEAPGLGVYSTRGPNGDTMPEDPDKLIEDIDWHTDQAYTTTPNRGKILYALQVPEEGGLTGFIDGYATYDALSTEMKKRIDSLHVIQSWDRLQDYRARPQNYRLDGEKQLARKFPAVAHPLAHAHPISGKRVLNVSPLWSAGIAELPGAEGAALLEELITHIRQPQYHYWHRYDVGDALIWDNWRFSHAASGTPGRYVRTLWKIVIKGGPEFGYLLPEAA